MSIQPTYTETHNGAPKRSNSGREIVYVFPQPGGSARNPTATQSEVMPADVQRALELLRNYSFRDIYRWLKNERQDEINRSSIGLNRQQSSMCSAQPTPRMSVVSSAHGSSRASSIFSAGAKRISVASTNTQYSHMSDPGQPTVPNMGWEATLPLNSNRHVSLQTAHMINIQQHNPPATLINSPAMKNARPNVISGTPPRPSTRQRESDVEAKKKYFCTACNKGFARKYDWKVHEQRYHEQQTQYPCPDCNQILFAETLFKSHHRDAHGCQDCPHAKTIAKDVDVRRKRTAWGCGFCSEFLDDWEKRCDHVATHYDNGTKREEWDHSKVVVGLLRQPDVDPDWRQYLLNRHGHFPSDLGLRFSKETTGRSHGENAPQLQDLLEFGACPRDVSLIVQLAYEHGYRRPASSIPASQAQPHRGTPVSPPYSGTQETISESPEHPKKQESPTEFVTPMSDSSPAAAFSDVNMNSAMRAYQTPADSRICSVGPTGSSTMANPLDWNSYHVYPARFAIQDLAQHALPAQDGSVNRMSTTYDKPLPSIPPGADMALEQESIGTRALQEGPPQLAGFLTEEDFSSETWSLVGTTLVDDPNISHAFYAHEHQFG